MQMKKQLWGEPYILEGKRIIFTDWTYIRPCNFGWYNSAGELVSVSGDEGPFEAHFRTFSRPWGIHIKAQPAVRTGPILQPELPWEANRTLIHTIIQENGLFRAWGTCSNEAVHGDISEAQQFFCYYESDDGYAWRRPDVGLVNFQGSKNNNLLPGMGGMVFVDPVAEPGERYKWIGTGGISREAYETCKAARPGECDVRCERPDVGYIFANLGAVSPDGLQWTDLPEPLALEHSDTQLTAYYDKALGKYVCYTRYWPGRVQPCNDALEPQQIWWASLRRSIGRAESDDFCRFPISESLAIPGAERGPSEVFYTNCRTVLPGTGDHHAMFPAVWDTSTDTTCLEFWTSPDGRAWNRVPGCPVLETAPFGAWDGGCLFASPNLVELPGGDFALPYTGYDLPHKYPRGKWNPRTGYALWHRGRISAVESPERGAFTTMSFQPPGERLYVNVRTKRAGSIRIALEGAEWDRPLPGYGWEDAVPIVGDHHRMQVRWRGTETLPKCNGAPIALMVEMDGASLYALEFE